MNKITGIAKTTFRYTQFVAEKLTLPALVTTVAVI